MFPKDLSKKEIKSLNNMGLKYPNSSVYISTIKVRFDNYFDKKNQIYVIKSGKGYLLKRSSNA